MSTTTGVNPQVTDAVTQANTRGTATAGNAPAMALGYLYQATANALSVAAHTAVVSQQQQDILAQAASMTQLVPPRSRRLAIRPAATLPSRPGKEFSCQPT